MKLDEFGIPICECHSAEQFIAELNEIHSRWRDGTWIYRGHNSTTWTLLPSAMRCSFERDYVSFYPRRFTEQQIREIALAQELSYESAERWNSWFVHQRAELEIVLTFEAIADRVGLKVPNDRHVSMGQSPRNLAEDLRKQLADEGATSPARPPSDVIMYQPTSLIVALAQHYGVPTRLLDWTFRPYYAAFFAAHSPNAESTERKCAGKSDNLVVWAVKTNELHRTSLKLISHQGRRSQIGFLYAQDGVFLYDEYASPKFLQHGNWRPMEEELLKLAELDSVFKLTLQNSEAAKLLELLERKSASKSYLMPSFKNSAEQVLAWRFEEWNKILDVEGHDRL